MKTSADIFSRVLRIRPSLFLLCAVTFILAASCATAPKFTKGRRLGNAVASWYGPKFHGKLTASGERYDMNALTCAHKKLPFGTRLEITNVKNGDSVVVVVNDRGPFVRGRDIDLSRAAAEKIGIKAEGVGKVKVVYLGRDMRYRKYLNGESVQKVSRSAAKSSSYTIQLAAFREKENAEHLRDGLRLNHKSVYIMEKWVNGNRYYRVRVGKFRSEDDAFQYGEKLADEGYETQIVPYEKSG